MSRFFEVKKLSFLLICLRKKLVSLNDKHSYLDVFEPTLNAIVSGSIRGKRFSHGRCRG